MRDFEERLWTHQSGWTYTVTDFSAQLIVKLATANPAS